MANNEVQSTYFSHQPPKRFDKTLRRRNRDKNGAAAKVQEKRTAQSTKTNKWANNASSTSSSDFMDFPKKPYQASETKPPTAPSPSPDTNLHSKWGGEWGYAIGIFTTNVVIVGAVGLAIWWLDSDEDIPWKDIVDNYLESKGARLQVINEKSVQIQPVPGTSVEMKKSLRLTIDSSNSCGNVAPVIETLELRAEPKDETPCFDDRKELEPERDLPVVPF